MTLKTMTRRDALQLAAVQSAQNIGIFNDGIAVAAQSLPDVAPLTTVTMEVAGHDPDMQMKVRMFHLVLKRASIELGVQAAMNHDGNYADAYDGVEKIMPIVEGRGVSGIETTADMEKSAEVMRWAVIDILETEAKHAEDGEHKTLEEHIACMRKTAQAFRDAETDCVHMAFQLLRRVAERVRDGGPMTMRELQKIRYEELRDEHIAALDDEYVPGQNS